MKQQKARRFLAGLPILLLICSLIFFATKTASAEDVPATEAPVSTEEPVVIEAPALLVAPQANTKDEDPKCNGNEEWDEVNQICVEKDHGQPTGVSVSQTPNPSHDGTPDPCTTPSNNSDCGNGDHGQGNPTKAQANCRADQGEVDPNCTPTAIATTPVVPPSNTPQFTLTAVSTNTTVPTATNSCFEVLGFYFGDCPATATPVFTETPVPTDTALPTYTFVPTQTLTLTQTINSTETMTPIPTGTGTSVVSDSGSEKGDRRKFCLFETDVKTSLVDDINGDGYNDVIRFWLDENGKKTGERNLSGKLVGTKSWPTADNCIVAFVNTDANGQSDIWTVGSKGGGLQRITNDATVEAHLDIRNGRLVYTDVTNGILHSMKLDGSDNVMLTAGSNAVVLPSNFMVFAYNGTIWGMDENGVAKDSHIAGTPIAWTYSCLVILTDTLNCYNFTTQQNTAIAANDFVGQPNATSLQGLFTDNATLGIFDPFSTLFAAYSPDWYRWDAKSDGSIEAFFKNQQ